MKCPICNCPDLRVLDSRPVDDDTSIKRRRECVSCGRRFTTYEVIDTVPVSVVKRDGSVEFFDKHKLTMGIARACQKRPVDAVTIADEIEAELQNSLVERISSSELGEIVLSHLKELDIVSYIRFASVYREFQDIDSFMAEIKSLGKRGRKRINKSEDISLRLKSEQGPPTFNIFAQIEFATFTKNSKNFAQKSQKRGNC